MYTVEIYGRVRRAVVVDGRSIRQVARDFGIHRQTVRKMVEFSLPPGYRQTTPRRRPKLGPFLPVIDEILRSDQEAPRKQRHTAKRIFERLVREYGYSGGYTVVKDYVREQRVRSREVFVPLSHRPGTAQADFGQAAVRIGGVLMVGHVFAFDLPHSDAGLVQVYPAESTEAFQQGHLAAFEFFGGVPWQILYDNTKLAVARIHRDGRRDLTRAFNELCSHFLFEAKFGRPRKGNDKGNVEGLVRIMRQSYFVPVPSAASFEELNGRLREACRERLERRVRGQAGTIGERLQRDREAFLPLPAGRFEACETRPGRVSSCSLVRYRTNDYSVPTRYGHRDILVRGYVDEVVISCGAEVIARHRRNYGRDQFEFDPRHYLELLEQKPGALDQAAPLEGWELPAEFDELRRRLEARLGNPGRREFVQVLRLLETFPVPEVGRAIQDAFDLGAVGFDAIKHLLLCRLERRPPRLDLELYPYLPSARVETTRASSYLALLGRGQA